MNFGQLDGDCLTRDLGECEEVSQHPHRLYEVKEAIHQIEGSKAMNVLMSAITTKEVEVKKEYVDSHSMRLH